jgi:hypothetical protein
MSQTSHAQTVDLSSNLVVWLPFTGTADDRSGNGLHGVVHGCVLTEDRLGVANAAYSFNGTDSYISVPHDPRLNPTTNGFSVVLWVKADPSQPSPNAHFILLDKNHTVLWNPSSVGGWFLNGIVGGDFAAGFTTTDGTVYDCLMPTTRILDDQWHMVAWVFDGTINSFYLDGVFVSQSSAAGFLPSLDNTSEVRIGHLNFWEGANGRFFRGAMDDIRIYNRALNVSEVQTLSGAPVLSPCLFSGLLISGTVGNRYQVQATTNLSNPVWETLDTVTLTNTSQYWIDARAPLKNACFYRVVSN